MNLLVEARHLVTDGYYYVVVFLALLTVLIFVHELGHYLVARRNGVKVEVFSIGFGPEVIGWFDRAGTRWKLSAVPLGGYVRMFGDADPSSFPADALPEMSEAERAVSFHHKRLWQRFAVVAAGPAANFLFAILLLAGLFATVGEPFTPPDVGEVQPHSAAAEAGIRPGDAILSINGTRIERFEDVQRMVYPNPGLAMRMVLMRDGQKVTLDVTPQARELTDRFGNVQKVGLLGIQRQGIDYVRRNPAFAVVRAADETWLVSASALQGIWQMIKGERGTDELAGPLGMAKMTGEIAQGRFPDLISFAAMISINLGLINLFPIPVLDGGHLLFYVAEAVRGRPLGRRAQEYGFRIGLAFVLTLMVFVTWNDLVRLRIVEFLRSLVS